MSIDMTDTNNRAVIVGMSGGVDSSVSAFLLKEAGYRVMGITMKLCEGLNGTGEASENAATAAAVAEKLGIEFKAVDYRPEFREHVIAQFIDEYEHGRTPNPCIQCNKHLKFGKLLYDNAEEIASMWGTENVLIATGHYAVVEQGPEYAAELSDENGNRISTGETPAQRWRLVKSENLAKDQSYFLYTLPQETLSRIIFPLAGMEKDQVRQIAESQQLVNAKKKDSQDICFIPDGDYFSFINSFTGKEYPEGDFVDEDGNVLGRHRGIIKYTVGQRKGLGLALKKPMYVHHLDTEKNQVVLSENDALFRRDLKADDFNWVSMRNPIEQTGGQGDVSFPALGRIRYRHKEAPCTVTAHTDGTVSVLFDEPQRAITAGQSLVLYDRETDSLVLGGGTISL